MGTPTYIPLANLTLGSSAASVTFSSISQAYRDLVLVVNGGTDGYSGLYRVRFNGDTGSNYSWVYMAGNGTDTLSSTGSGTSFGLSSAYAATPSTYLNVTNIFDYSASDKHKSLLSRGNAAATGVDAFAGRWASTSSITSVTVTTTNANTFAAGSSMALYGIAA